MVHFFDQYWTSLAFGLGLLFYPLLLLSIWRAIKRWTWPMLAAVVLPFCAFTIYWGASLTGMLREGLQYWVLILIAVVALQQAATGFPWLRSVPVRLILCVRAVEVFAVLVGMTWGTRGLDLVSGNFGITDTVALLAMIALSALLVGVVWRETGSGLRRAPGPQPAPPSHGHEAQ